jgi:hypothetical protein
MLDVRGLSALADRRTVMRKEPRRFGKLPGEEFRIFYNPMWSFLGDASSGPPGTYYRGPAGQVSFFWHMFDQVLFRPNLLPRFDSGDLAILTSAGDQSLMTVEEIPDTAVASDHLPLLFRLNLDEGGD